MVQFINEGEYMGEIAEMMIDGILCEDCGGFVGKDKLLDVDGDKITGMGMPMKCEDCEEGSDDDDFEDFRFDEYDDEDDDDDEYDDGDDEDDDEVDQSLLQHHGIDNKLKLFEVTYRGQISPALEIIEAEEVGIENGVFVFVKNKDDLIIIPIDNVLKIESKPIQKKGGC